MFAGDQRAVGQVRQRDGLKCDEAVFRSLAFERRSRSCHLAGSRKLRLAWMSSQGNPSGYITHVPQLKIPTRLLPKVR